MTTFPLREKSLADASRISLASTLIERRYKTCLRKPCTGLRAEPLWQIGKTDHSAAEFALAKNEYTQFLRHFGSPDRAFYVGLSKPEDAWPCVLPGPLDQWAGGAENGSWDQMNTLPVGFVLEATPSSGTCRFTVATCASKGPQLRVAVNGTMHEASIPPGGDDACLSGDFTKAQAGETVVEFPSSELRPGYNEITLRSVSGSWLVFDSVRLDTPAGAKLAPATPTVVRFVGTAPYAVGGGGDNTATLRIEVYQHKEPGTLSVGIDGALQKQALEPGLQVLEVAAPASPEGGTTAVRLHAADRLLLENWLALPSSPAVTPADYVDVFRGTAHSRWMIAPGPWMPFGMAKLAPDNQPQGWAAGYEYSHDYIDCFSHLHEWTMGGLGMLPTVGPLRTRPGLDGSGYSSRFDKASERGGVGFYDWIAPVPIVAFSSGTIPGSLPRNTHAARNASAPNAASRIA